MVGATGSGKTTTLAAMLNHRNENQAGHILTIEDPIEFSHPNTPVHHQPARSGLPDTSLLRQCAQELPA